MNETINATAHMTTAIPAVQRANVMYVSCKTTDVSCCAAAAG